MVIVVDKNTDKKEIEAALKKVKRDTAKPALADFKGKLKDTFGDALEYQKKLRDEWD
ncbi:MAG: hypothetical protein ACHQHN_10155 [Sphingobacteriales bacterium]